MRKKIVAMTLVFTFMVSQMVTVQATSVMEVIETPRFLAMPIMSGYRYSGFRGTASGFPSVFSNNVVRKESSRKRSFRRLSQTAERISHKAF